MLGIGTRGAPTHEGEREQQDRNHNRKTQPAEDPIGRDRNQSREHEEFASRGAVARPQVRERGADHCEEEQPCPGLASNEPQHFEIQTGESSQDTVVIGDVDDRCGDEGGRELAPRTSQLSIASAIEHTVTVAVRVGGGSERRGEVEAEHPMSGKLFFALVVERVVDVVALFVFVRGVDAELTAYG